MITNTLQKRINSGDREAFRSVYNEYGRGVFLTAVKALGSEAEARAVVKQTFLNLHRELLNAVEDIDLPVRIHELTEHELMLAKIIRNKGVFDAAAQGGSVGAAYAASGSAASSARNAFAGGDPAGPDAPLPPLERAYAYMEADRVFASRRSGENRSEPGSGRRGGFLRFLLILLLLILLWVLAGVLMDVQLIRAYDLGYSWFNETIYPLFSLFV